MSEREDRSRLSEIMQVLRRYRITKGITPVKVREILEELGPTYVKLGQILSIRTDLISSEYCKELQKLRSQVSPMPYDEVRAVLYEAYEKDPEDVFASIVKTPIGSASIAQVHEAFLKSGEHVVLKVQRRGIYGTMERDVAMMQRMLRFVPPALNGLDMEVKKGDIYGFVGPNGAGKTTTLRIISGLLKSDGGDLWLDGVRTTKNILKQKSLIGFVPDFFGVYENLNVIEYLEFFAASYGIYGRAGTVRAREVLEMVELSGKEEQMVDSLSRGIQQRLCLARAMIHKPKLLVLDEPNSGLDPRSRKDFQLLLQRLAREDYTILISSHILSELADLCTSIGVINGGVMVQQGKLENIMLAVDSSNPLRITVLNQVPKALELLRQDPQVSRLSVDENKIAAWFSGSREEEAYLLQKLVDAGILVVSFAREHNSLESLFFHLTGETEQKSRNTETFGNTIG